MLNQNALAQLKGLKLEGMAQAFEEQLIQPAMQALSFEERFGMVVDREVNHRDNQKLKRLLKNAKLKVAACTEDIDYRTGRGLDKATMASLITCNWVRGGQNLLITGATGCGKTWLACALGNQACRQGLSVLYFRTPRLLEEMRISHGDGSYRKRLLQLAKTDLVIFDDWGLSPLGQIERSDLLEIIDDRTRRSTLITSQLPVASWHEYIGEPTVADAILDRLVHSAHKIALAGESMRKRKAPEKE